MWDEFSVRPEELIDAGERVVVVARWRGTAKGSGLPLDRVFAHVWTVRDGKLVRHEVFSDREVALRQAGLVGRVRLEAPWALARPRFAPAGPQFSACKARNGVISGDRAGRRARVQAPQKICHTLDLDFCKAYLKEH